MEIMSAREAADKWGISQRRVAVLCSENRIADAEMVGNMWVMPSNAKKPIDARSTRYNKSDEKSVKPFLKWAGGKTQMLDDIEFTKKGINKNLISGDDHSGYFLCAIRDFNFSFLVAPILQIAIHIQSSLIIYIFIGFAFITISPPMQNQHGWSRLSLRTYTMNISSCCRLQFHLDRF